MQEAQSGPASVTGAAVGGRRGADAGSTTIRAIETGLAAPAAAATAASSAATAATTGPALGGLHEAVAGPNDLHDALAGARGLLQAFTTERRLYHLTGIGAAAALAEQLLVESWTLHEALSQPYVLQIHALSTDARLPVGELLGQFLVLHTLLADGSRSPRSGIVLAAEALACDGGLARFALTLGPWSALNQHVFGSGLHQGVPVTEIAERSWRRLAPRADWAWAADVAGHLSRSPFHDDQAASPGRRLCSQWRETDHAFLERLLAEEGIGYAFEEVGSAQAEHDGGTHPAGAASPHRLRAFADSTTLPWDDTVQRDGAIRFHQAGAVQAQDAVQAWGSNQRFCAARTSVLAWHRKAKRAVAATSATADAHQGHFAAPGAPRLEHYLVSGPASGSPATTEQAQRAATLLREAEECRLQLHIGRSTVRTLRAGRRIRLAGAPAHNGEHLVTAVAHAGFNNLPKDLALTIERRIGAARLPTLPRPDASWSDEARAVLDARHAGAEGAAGGPSVAPSGPPAVGAFDSSFGGSFSGPFGSSCGNPFGDLFSAALGESFGLAADGRALARRPVACGLPEDVVAQAQRTGYANALCAIPASTPWRPQRWRSVMPQRTSASSGLGSSTRPAVHSPTQQPLHPKPEAPPVTTALVVGPQGEAVPQPGQEIHTDRLGRVRVRFHWQVGERADDTHTPWLRVAQRLAGPGMGWHFTPRIGQEVLVGFLCDDIDQPIVLGALYNGQGEAGVPPTPGGQAAGEARPRGRAAGDAGHNAADVQGPGRGGAAADPADAHTPDASHDHRAAAQGNRIGTGAGGHAPAWHGAAARSHAHAAAFTGIKTQEFASAAGSSSAPSPGYNQLVFDDTPQQLRVQLATTQHATQLNLGHLIHQADNHRGSLRGQGWELRTDAWGSVRATRGVLLTTYGLRPGPTSPEPAGDNTAGLALARQMTQQAQALSQAAAAHQTVPLASHQGSTSAAASALSDCVAPLPALYTALAGEVHGATLHQALADAPAWMQRASSAATAGADAGARVGAGAGAGANKPHTAAPVIAATARGGLIQTAAQDIVAAAQDTLHLATGGHSSQAIGGQGRTHTGQAIGVLAGAIQPGPNAAGIGLSFIAAQGDLTAQAQAGTMQLAARDTVRLQSAARHIDWTAAKRIVLSVAGGASLTIDGSGITVQCPGKLTIQAGKKSFVGASTVDARLDALPAGGGFQRRFVLRRAADGQPLPAQRYRVTLADGRTVEGTTNERGETELAQSAGMQAARLDLLHE